jgi:hypothetical protein
MKTPLLRAATYDVRKDRGQTACFATQIPSLSGSGGAKKVVSPRGFLAADQPRGEKGYALLFVFLMAAIVALFLYEQLPRVAFESERDKEQLLIDRGEQYKRAIQLYVIALKKYPSKIEDLENTNEKRYLRQRYIDPMTGKDEWRLIHVNAAGVLTDSLVQKPPGTDANGNGQSGTTGAGGTLGTSSSATFGSPTGTAPGVNGSTGSTTNPATPPNPNDVNNAVRRRPSDVVGQAYTSPVNADPNDPSTWAPISLTPVGTANGGAPTGQPPSGAVGFNGGLPGQQPGQQPGMMPGQQPGQPGFPVQPGTAGGGFPLPGQPGFNPTQNQFKIDANGQLVPIQPTQAGAVINSQTGGMQNTPLSAPQPGQQPAGINAPGMSPGNSVGAQNAATAAINNMLTNPNQQAGANGLGTAGGMTQGGIAGVASMYKGTSIKTYGARQKYQEWEFIFSLNNQQNGTGQNRNPLTPGQNGLAPGQTPGQPGQNGPGNPPPIGSTTGNPGTGN